MISLYTLLVEARNSYEPRYKHSLAYTHAKVVFHKPLKLAHIGQTLCLAPVRRNLCSLPSGLSF
jgi:hypothetical protein